MKQYYGEGLIRLWLVTLMLFLTTVFIIRFSSTIKIFLIAIGLSYVLMPIVNGMEKCLLNRHSDELRKECLKVKHARGYAVLMVLFFTLVAIFLFIGMVLPYLTGQLKALILDFPNIRLGAENLLNLLTDRLVSMNLPDSITDSLQNFMATVNTFLMNIAIDCVSWVAQASSGLMNIIIIIILLIYFLIDGPYMISICRDYLLRHGLNRIVGLLQVGSHMTRMYLKTQALISGGMTIIAFIGLNCFTIPYAGLFALLIFVLDFIPYFGSIFGTLVIIVFTLIEINLKTAIGIGIFLLILQQVEGNIFAPKIQGKVVGVHAAFIMLSLMVCFELWGPIGMLLSTMIAGMMKIVLSDLLEFLMDPEISLREFLAGRYTGPLIEVSQQSEKEE